MKGLKILKKLLLVGGLIFSNMSLSSCKHEEKGNIIDCSGNRFEFTSVPSRVICLQASLGSAWQLAGGEFIGISDDYDDYNLEINNATIIGTTKKPNAEIILELSPDLVIYSSKITGENDVCENIKQLGIKCFDATIDSFDDYLYILNQFCKITGRDDLYKTNGLDVKDRISNTISKCPNINNPKVLFIRSYSSGYNILSSGNIVTYMLKDLKTNNVAKEGTDLNAEVSLESVLVENPDFVFVVYMGTSNIAKSQAYLESNLLSRADFKQINAVKNGKVYYLPSSLFHFKPNNKWDESYEYLYEILYGEEK